MQNDELAGQWETIANDLRMLSTHMQALPNEEQQRFKQLVEHLNAFHTATTEQSDQFETINQALHQANEHLRVIFDNIRDYAVFTLDLENRIISWNPGAERVFGWTEAEAVGQPGALIFTPEDREKREHEKEIQGALNHGVAEDKRWHLRKDGSLFFASGTVRRLHDPQGKLLGFIKVTRDATAEIERQQADERLHESERKLSETVQYLEFVFDAARAADYEMDVRVGTVRHSPSLNALFGFPLDSIPSFADFRARYHPDDPALMASVVTDARQGMTFFQRDFRIVLPNQTIRWIHSRGEVILDAEGQPMQIRGVAIDITERKQTEERQSFLLKLSDTLRSLGDPINLQYQAVSVLGEHLGANRVGYAEAEPDGETIVVTRNYTNGVPGIEGKYRYADYGAMLQANLESGMTVVRPDIANDPNLTDAHKEAHAVLQLGATVNVPLVKEGRLIAVLFVHYQAAHTWTAEELTLIEETAVRTWDAVERARAEARQRQQHLIAEALRDTAAELSSKLNLSDLLQQTFISAHRLIRYNAAYIVLCLDGKCTDFHSEGLFPKDRQILQQWNQQLESLESTPLYQQSARDGQITVIRDRKRVRRLLPIKWVHAVLVIPLVPARMVVGYFVLLNEQDFEQVDMTALQAFAYQLTTAITNAQLFLQAQELAVIQERQQLARDLHDAVSQTLFTANMMLEALLGRWEYNSKQLRDVLADISRLVKGAQAEMRTLLLELRPTHLQDTPFVDLLRQLIEAVQARKHTEISLEFSGEPLLPPEVHINIYRIAQEALNNITRHSRASRIWIAGRGGPDDIELHIRDNGQGFLPDQPTTRMGLQMMRERAYEIGARLEVRSSPGTGTDIHVIWPSIEMPLLSDD